MGAYLAEKIIAILRKPWLQVGLCAAAVSVIVISLCYGENLWTVIGAVGTWATGIFAGFIAYAQLSDLRQKNAKIQFHTENSINDGIMQAYKKIERYSFQLGTQTLFYRENKTDYSDLFKTLREISEDWPSIQLDPYQIEIISAEYLQKTKTFNEAVVQLKGKCRRHIAWFSEGPKLSEKLFAYRANLYEMEKFLLSTIHLLPENDENNKYLDFLKCSVFHTLQDTKQVETHLSEKEAEQSGVNTSPSHS